MIQNAFFGKNRSAHLLKGDGVRGVPMPGAKSAVDLFGAGLRLQPFQILDCFFVVGVGSENFQPLRASLVETALFRIEIAELPTSRYMLRIQQQHPFKALYRCPRLPFFLKNAGQIEKLLRIGGLNSHALDGRIKRAIRLSERDIAAYQLPARV